MYTPQVGVKDVPVIDNDDIVIKGENINFKVDMKLLEKHLDYFRDQHHLKINELTGEDRERFNNIVSNVQLMFNTPFYKKFHQKIESRFGNLEHVNPGTIGGYMNGCLVKSKFPGNPNCSP